MDFGSALERSAALRSKVSAMERAFAASPDDRGLRITLLSARRMAERAEAELAEAAKQSDIDLCRYRVKKTDDLEVAYPAVAFAESIVTYQEVFTAIYDQVRNGAKAVASYSKEVRQNSSLGLAYTFPGSLGVLLTVSNRRDLFDVGELDRVIASLNEVVELESIDQVRAVAHDKGLNVVRKVFKWADQNWKSAFSVDVQWTRSDSVVKGGFIPREKFLRTISLIEQTSDELPEEFEITGSLVGLHLLSDTFAISTANGDMYSGRLAQGFDKRQYKVPSLYKAKIRRKTTIKYATEATIVNYQLLALEDAP